LSSQYSIYNFWKNCSWITSNMTLWAKSHHIRHCNCNCINIYCTVGIIYLYQHLNQLTWHVSILRKRHSRWSKSFAHAAATCNLSARLFLLWRHYSSFSQYDLAAALNSELWGDWFNSSSHMINDDSLFLRSIMIEAGWPTLKCFKAKGERILPWWKSAALIYHHSVAGEHISSLKIFNFKVTIGRGANKSGTMVEVCIFLRLTIWNVHFLNQH